MPGLCLHLYLLQAQIPIGMRHPANHLGSDAAQHYDHVIQCCARVGKARLCTCGCTLNLNEDQACCAQGPQHRRWGAGQRPDAPDAGIWCAREHQQFESIVRLCAGSSNKHRNTEGVLTYKQDACRLTLPGSTSPQTHS